MDTIFHEKQEGSLCAQHCLNALLQGSYFTPVDLAELAQQMDDEERSRMAESGVDSEEYRRFLEQPSGNYDDSGYFSVQVISMALEVWNLELVPYNSTEPRALQAQNCPADMQAYICNYRDHWFAIRRLGHQWFNLNSLLTGPELISDTYLAMFLAQLQQEGYSLFMVFGTFPECDADNLLRVIPAVQTVKPRAVADSKHLGGGVEEDHELQRVLKLSLGMSSALRMPEDKEVKDEDDDDDDVELRNALRLSTATSSGYVGGSTEEERELQQALKLSLGTSGASQVPGGQEGNADDDDDVELRNALRRSTVAGGKRLGGDTEEDRKLPRVPKLNVGVSEAPQASKVEEELQDCEDEALQHALRLSLQQDDDCEQSELERAIKLSLECESPGSRVDTDDVRRKRLAYLQGRSGGSQQSLDMPSASLAESRVNT